MGVSDLAFRFLPFPIPWKVIGPLRLLEHHVVLSQELYSRRRAQLEEDPA